MARRLLGFVSVFLLASCGEASSTDDATDDDDATETCPADPALVTDRCRASYGACASDPAVLSNCEALLAEPDCESLHDYERCRLEMQALARCEEAGSCDSLKPAGVDCRAEAEAYFTCLGVSGWDCEGSDTSCACRRALGPSKETCSPLPCCRITVHGDGCHCQEESTCYLLEREYFIPVESCPP